MIGGDANIKGNNLPNISRLLVYGIGGEDTLPPAPPLQLFLLLPLRSDTRRRKRQRDTAERNRPATERHLRRFTLYAPCCICLHSGRLWPRSADLWY